MPSFRSRREGAELIECDVFVAPAAGRLVDAVLAQRSVCVAVREHRQRSECRSGETDFSASRRESLAGLIMSSILSGCNISGKLEKSEGEGKSALTPRCSCAKKATSRRSEYTADSLRRGGSHIEQRLRPVTHRGDSDGWRKCRFRKGSAISCAKGATAVMASSVACVAGAIGSVPSSVPESEIAKSARAESVRQPTHPTMLRLAQCRHHQGVAGGVAEANLTATGSPCCTLACTPVLP